MMAPVGFLFHSASGRSLRTFKMSDPRHLEMVLFVLNINELEEQVHPPQDFRASPLQPPLLSQGGTRMALSQAPAPCLLYRGHPTTQHSRCLSPRTPPRLSAALSPLQPPRRSKAERPEPPLASASAPVLLDSTLNAYLHQLHLELRNWQETLTRAQQLQALSQRALPLPAGRLPSSGSCRPSGLSRSSGSKSTLSCHCPWPSCHRLLQPALGQLGQPFPRRQPPQANPS